MCKICHPPSVSVSLVSTPPRHPTGPPRHQELEYPGLGQLNKYSTLDWEFSTFLTLYRRSNVGIPQDYSDVSLTSQPTLYVWTLTPKISVSNPGRGPIPDLYVWSSLQGLRSIDTRSETRFTKCITTSPVVLLGY